MFSFKNNYLLLFIGMLLLLISCVDKKSSVYYPDEVGIVMPNTPGTVLASRKILISGNHRTEENVIRRELMFFPGDNFSRDKLYQSYRDIYMLNNNKESYLCLLICILILLPGVPFKVFITVSFDKKEPLKF